MEIFEHKGFVYLTTGKKTMFTIGNGPIDCIFTIFDQCLILVSDQYILILPYVTNIL